MNTLDALLIEMRLTYAERRDRLEAAQMALVRGDKRAPFTVEEIAKRRGRLPQLEAVGRGLAVIAGRRGEVPAWILEAFEGGQDA